MSAFSDSWHEALGAGAGTADEIDPDDGTYAVTILTAQAEMTSRGTELGRIRLKIEAGDHAGSYFDHMLFFGSPFAMEKSIHALRRYGVDVHKVHEFEDLHAEMKKIVGDSARVSVAHENEYLRIEVLDSVRPERVPESTFAEAAAKSNDDVPF